MTPVTAVAKPLSMTEIKNKAQNLGINPGTMKKTELIRSIQKAEGNSACYGTTNGTCQWNECCFRSDCLKIKN